MPGHELKVESFVIKLAVEHYIIHPSFFVIVIEQEKATHKCLWTDTMVYMCGVFFALRNGQEHCDLQ